jgi:hypothetical protein
MREYMLLYSHKIVKENMRLTVGTFVTQMPEFQKNRPPNPPVKRLR